MQKNLKNHILEVTKSDPGGDAYNATTYNTYFGYTGDCEHNMD